MAYVRNYSYATETAGTATTVTAPMPTHETNDLILFLVGKDAAAGGVWTTPGGDLADSCSFRKSGLQWTPGGPR